jgi:hypothetical protein
MPEAAEQAAPGRFDCGGFARSFLHNINVHRAPFWRARVLMEDQSCPASTEAGKAPGRSVAAVKLSQSGKSQNGGALFPVVAPQ